jgi:hypothetical protein
MIKSRRMRWAVRVVCKGEKRNGVYYYTITSAAAAATTDTATTLYFLPFLFHFFSLCTTPLRALRKKCTIDLKYLV